MKKYYFIALLLLGVLSSCKNETIYVDLGYDYFPMQKGVFVEYEVTEVFHDKDLDPKQDTTRYRLKTVIGDTIIDNSGRIAREYFQYRYFINSNELIDQRVWTRLIDEKRGEIVEENQRKIRLVFPVKIGEEWDLNAFNPEEEWRISYEDVHKERMINGMFFDSTARIIYDDFLTLVDFKKTHEIYAKGIGMVERSFKDLRINNFDTLQIQKGNEIFYKILSFGKE